MQLEETRLPVQGSGNFAAGTDFFGTAGGARAEDLAGSTLAFDLDQMRASISDYDALQSLHFWRRLLI
jgi:hypothetical protein